MANNSYYEESLTVRKVSAGSGDSATCAFRCPIFEGNSHDKDFIDEHQDELARCSELGGTQSRFVNGIELIICPVLEELSEQKQLGEL